MLLFQARPPAIIIFIPPLQAFQALLLGGDTADGLVCPFICPSAADLHPLHHSPSNRLGGQLLFAETVASLTNSLTVAMSVLVTSLTNLFPHYMKMTHSWWVYTRFTSLPFL